MKKYKVIPAYDCLIIGHEKQAYLQEGQAAIFDMPEILSVYPTQASRINYAFTLDLNSSQDSSFYQVQNYEDQTNFFLTSGISCKSFVAIKLDVDGEECKIELGESELTLYYKQTIKRLTLPNKFSSYKTGVIQSCCYCLLTSIEKQNLIVFDCNLGKVFSLTGDDIKINANNIVIIENLDDIARHTLQKEYVISASGLVKKNQTVSYQNGRATIATIPETIPYAFLESIACEDYELAFYYLDTNLKHQLDKEHLQKYFGQVVSYSPLNLTTYLICSKEGKKTISFSINENKIEEIGEI